jgi:AAA domain
MPTNLNSETYEKYIRALLVGPTGRGKTIAAASWPGKTLDVDFDGRHKPIIDWYPERVKAGDYSVETVSPQNFWTVFKPLIDNICKYNPYQNIIIDGITSLSTTTVVMQMLIKGSFKNWFGVKETSGDKEEGKGSKITAGGVMVPGWDEFNGEAMIISTLLETLKSLKCNLFVTAHPVSRTAIDKKKTTKYTSITTFGPKIESIIPTYFDEVWFFDYKVDTDSQGKEIIRRTVYTVPSEDYFEAKSSLKLPKEIDITDKNLYDCIKDYL